MRALAAEGRHPKKSGDGKTSGGPTRALFGRTPSSTATQTSQSTSFSTTVTTEAGYIGKYKMVCQEGMAMADFRQNMMVFFSVHIKSIVGGFPVPEENAYVGAYHGGYPDYELVLGDESVPWYYALAEMEKTNPEPWDWDMIHRTDPDFIKDLCAEGEKYCSFPIHGKMANIRRYNLSVVNAESVPANNTST